MAESTNNPLQYFEELLISNKYENLKRNFVSQLKEQVGSHFHSSDIENGIVKVEYNDDGKIGISTIVFHDEFLKEILIEENKVISNIDNSVIDISKTNSSFNKFLKLQISNIYILEGTTPKSV